MGSEVSEKVTEVTQVSIGGFDRHVKAKDLTDFLENEVGVVYRCRLKTSSTPKESYPNFNICCASNTSETNKYDDTVNPHAFVHFALPDSANWALNAAERGELILNDKPLKVILGPTNLFRLNQRRRTTNPFKLCDVYLEIGNLINEDQFVVVWKPPYGVNFLVDPYDDTCKFCFTRDTVFSFKGTSDYRVIKCDFKVEFSVRDITDIKQYTNTSSIVVLLHLASSPHVWYRTVDDDIC